MSKSKFYHVQLSYLEDPSNGVGSVQYTKQVLNELLTYDPIENFETHIHFPLDIIPGSETIFIDGVFISPEEYDLTTGIYRNTILDNIFISYSVLLDQEEGHCDHTEMPSLGVIELANPEELVSPNEDLVEDI